MWNPFPVDHETNSWKELKIIPGSVYDQYFEDWKEPVCVDDILGDRINNNGLIILCDLQFPDTFLFKITIGK